MTIQREFPLSDWQNWQEGRIEAVAAPFGLASLVATHWLGEAPQALEGLPGLWWAEGGDVVGIRLPSDFTDAAPGLADDDGAGLRIRPGEQTDRGGLRLRHMVRDGAVALRVLDSEAPGRLSLAGIDTYPVDESWRIDARFVPAPTEQIVEITSIDGYVRAQKIAGSVEFERDGVQLSLTVSGEPDDLSAVFADATSGHDSFHFRFLDFEQVAHDGSLVIDFTRAYLPPCAFSDFYVCPLPLPGNRLAVEVRAGERQVRRV